MESTTIEEHFEQQSVEESAIFTGSLEAMEIELVQKFSREIERWFELPQSVVPDDLKQLKKQLATSCESVLQHLDSLKLSESIVPLTTTCLILLEICQPGRQTLPTCLGTLIANIHQSHPELNGQAVNVESVRDILRTYLPGAYREEELIGLVYETEETLANLSVLDSEGNEKFSAWAPFDCFDRKPKEGDKYGLVVWALWQHWYGVEGTHIESARWTKEDAHELQKLLEDAQARGIASES